MSSDHHTDPQPLKAFYVREGKMWSTEFGKHRTVRPGVDAEGKPIVQIQMEADSGAELCMTMTPRQAHLMQSDINKALMGLEHAGISLQPTTPGGST